jgi:hypothetical protein
MPDEPTVVRGIDWKSTFPFTHIFRSFRIAIHPSKLVLALAAVFLIYAGGNIMDAIWFRQYKAVPDEVTLFTETRGEADAAQQFSQRREAIRQQIDAVRVAELQRIGKPDGTLADLKADYVKTRNDAAAAASKEFDPANGKTPEEQARLRTQRDDAIRAIYDRANTSWDAAQASRGLGLFYTFWSYELNRLHRVVAAGRNFDWLGQGGVIDELIHLLGVAPGWGISQHPLFFIILGLYMLVIWAIFGGAIARIAAVQVARDEKISFRQALSFSTAKFLSFVSAPIIPVAIILVVGAVVWLGAVVLFNIPWIGPILGGALFFLALAAGFVMTLVLIGLLGGFNLMYPTIAVEGSDSFDAISRSFSYLFARPWRLVFYSIVAGVYGTICYVFVRYFIMLMLSLTHHFAGWGVFVRAENRAPLWSVLWPDVMTNGRLVYSIDHLTLNSGQDIGASLLALWIYLTIAVLAAFAMSFYFSANTVIYILMRHEVDATEMDDVYLEQTDEEFTESTMVSGTSPAPAPAATPEPAPAAPPEASPADNPPPTAS